MQGNDTQNGCNPKNLKVIKDSDNSVVIIQAELISAIGEVKDPHYKSGRKTYVYLNTISPLTYNFYISPEEVLSQLNAQTE